MVAAQEKTLQERGDAEDVHELSFKDLGLHPRLLRALKKKGLNKPTPVQLKAIPPILEGKDVVLRTNSAPGKIHSYLLPLVHEFLEDGEDSGPQAGPRAFVLVPTPELVEQVHDEAQWILSSCRQAFKLVKLTSEMSDPTLSSAMAGPPDVVVATPAQISSCISNQLLLPSALQSSLSFLVLDEADRFISCGYEDNLRKLASLVPHSCQCLLMSATSGSEIKELKKLFLHNPVTLTLMDDIEHDSNLPESLEKSLETAVLDSAAVSAVKTSMMKSKKKKKSSDDKENDKSARNGDAADIQIGVVNGYIKSDSLSGLGEKTSEKNNRKRKTFEEEGDAKILTKKGPTTMKMDAATGSDQNTQDVTVLESVAVPGEKSSGNMEKEKIAEDEQDDKMFKPLEHKGSPDIKDNTKDATCLEIAETKKNVKNKKKRQEKMLQDEEDAKKSGTSEQGGATNAKVDVSDQRVAPADPPTENTSKDKKKQKGKVKVAEDVEDGETERPVHQDDATNMEVDGVNGMQKRTQNAADLDVQVASTDKPLIKKKSKEKIAPSVEYNKVSEPSVQGVAIDNKTNRKKGVLESTQEAAGLDSLVPVSEKSSVKKKKMRREIAEIAKESGPSEQGDATDAKMDVSNEDQGVAPTDAPTENTSKDKKKKGKGKIAEDGETERPVHQGDATNIKTDAVNVFQQKTQNTAGLDVQVVSTENPSIKKKSKQKIVQNAEYNNNVLEPSVLGVSIDNKTDEKNRALESTQEAAGLVSLVPVSEKSSVKKKKRQREIAEIVDNVNISGTPDQGGAADTETDAVNGVQGSTPDSTVLDSMVDPVEKPLEKKKKNKKKSSNGKATHDDEDCKMSGPSDEGGTVRMDLLNGSQGPTQDASVLDSKVAAEKTPVKIMSKSKVMTVEGDGKTPKSSQDFTIDKIEAVSAVQESAQDNMLADKSTEKKRKRKEKIVTDVDNEKMSGLSDKVVTTSIQMEDLNGCYESIAVVTNENSKKKRKYIGGKEGCKTSGHQGAVDTKKAGIDWLQIEALDPDFSPFLLSPAVLPTPMLTEGSGKKLEGKAVEDKFKMSKQQDVSVTTPSATDDTLEIAESNGNAPKRRKLSHGSGKERTPNFFQKININEVEYADPKLQDNSYWAKNGAEQGWGARAQEILGQVKGKGFRHEKTKKKRGSYKGGIIDFSSHSIKFKDSDDDE